MRIKIWMVCTLIASLTFPISQVSSKEPDRTVYEEKGNIFLKAKDKITQLTKTGRDSDPALSPNGKWVAFSREIEGKVQECSERNNHWACPSEQLWTIDLDNMSERMLLEPRTDVPQKRTKDVLYQFYGKEFSPDSRTIYFITPAWATSDAIHAVDIDGKYEHYVMHGYSYEVVRGPLSAKIKKYINNLKKDDWRIFPKKEGPKLIRKALSDDVLGHLIIERSGFRTITSPTPIDGGWLGEDGLYYSSLGRRLWTELTSPDGTLKIPIGGED
ncbi:MAG: hypothetical protein HOJ13_01840 [Nitrospina sp.]|nr:hypothetical protein [Nitrospina sp.]